MYLLIDAHISVLVCVCRCVYVCMYVWRPEEGVGCHLLVLTYMSVKQGLSPELEFDVFLAQLADRQPQLVSCLLFLGAVVTGVCQTPACLSGCWNLALVFTVMKPVLLTAEPSAQPVLFFKKIFLHLSAVCLSCVLACTCQSQRTACRDLFSPSTT